MMVQPSFTDAPMGRIEARFPSGVRVELAFSHARTRVTTSAPFEVFGSSWRTLPPGPANTAYRKVALRAFLNGAPATIDPAGEFAILGVPAVGVEGHALRRRER